MKLQFFGSKFCPVCFYYDNDVIDVFQMVVMDEVHKQMNDIAAKQKEKIDELNAEIRKLKAMIVKHESRIRTLETKNRELEQTQQFNNNGGAHSEDMDPDEV